MISAIAMATLIVLGCLEQVQITAQEQKRTIESLSWLAGCWQGSGKQEGVIEQWMQPAGGIMLGMSRTVRNGRAVEYEFLRIHDENGALVYTASPSGQETTSFTLAGGTANEFIFENKQHDFPQRIIYKLQDGSLLARIEGTINGNSRAIDFPMQRIQCPRGVPK